MNPPEHWSSALVRLGACAEAVEWAGAMPDLKTAWARCDRADWMLWYAARRAALGSAEHRAIVSAACAFARTALPYVPPKEDRPRLAIEAAERWVEGRATIDEVYAATDAAAAYVAAAYGDAAYASFAVASYAADAGAAADAAGAAAYAVKLDAMRRRALAEMADIVRELMPHPERIDP